MNIDKMVSDAGNRKDGHEYTSCPLVMLEKESSPLTYNKLKRGIQQLFLKRNLVERSRGTKDSRTVVQVDFPSKERICLAYSMKKILKSTCTASSLFEKTSRLFRTSNIKKRAKELYDEIQGINTFPATTAVKRVCGKTFATTIKADIAYFKNEKELTVNIILFYISKMHLCIVRVR